MLGLSLLILMLFTMTEPVSGTSSCVSILTKVDFPAPLGPTIKTNSPLSICIFILCWVAAYQPVQLTVSTDLILNIQTPGIYMIRKNESGRYIINYADPTQQRNVAELELNHKKVRLSLLEGKEKGKTTSIVG